MKEIHAIRNLFNIFALVILIWSVKPVVNLHAQPPTIAEPKTPDSLIDQLLSSDNNRGVRYFPRADLARAIAKDKSISPKIRVEVLTTVLRHELENPCPVTHIIHGGNATPTVYIQGQYVFGLADIGTEAIPHLRKSLDQLKVSVQNISPSLGNTENVDAVEMQHTLCALALLRDRNVFDDVLELFEDEEVSGYIRQKAAVGLKNLNNKAAIPALKHALKDDFHVISPHTARPGTTTTYPVRSAAYSALEAFGFEFELINDRQQWEYRIVKEP